MVRLCAESIQTAPDCTLGYRQTELKKCLLARCQPASSSKVDRIDGPALGHHKQTKNFPMPQFLHSRRKIFGSGLSLLRRPLPGRCPRRIGLGTHLHECLPHRLSRSAGLQFFYRRGQRPHDVFDLVSCHVGWTPVRPRLGKYKPNTARSRAEQCAPPRRKGCYQPETSQL